MTLLPVQPAHALAHCAAERSWLIEGLWASEAVGIVGGEPKCCKSFLALDMAVAVASGTPCLRRFPVPRRGRVLLFAAEDALHIVRSRLDGICLAAGLDLTDLDIQVITAPTIRLDQPSDRHALAETIAALEPQLLILDPFVRLHRIDENASGEVAPLLAFLRDLQRLHHLAVVVVHHAKKGASKSRAGQALRGSSEFHAWGDSNLYLRRQAEQLTLTIEHRAAASPPALALHLSANGQALALELQNERTTPTPAPSLTPAQRIRQALSDADGPQPLAALRDACRIRTATLCETLTILVNSGDILKRPEGYVLAALPVSLPAAP
jgi:hypothetical protein